jgi:Uma2 family endonuclease
MAQHASIATELTIAQWEALDDDVEGELVDGRLQQEEMPTFFHEAIVSFVLAALRAWLHPRGGLVLGSEAKLIVGPGRGRKPDVLAYLPGTPLPSRRRAASATAPDVVVEVISPTPRDRRRDRIDKKADYLAMGVKQYWLIDTEARTVEVLVHQGGQLVEQLSARAGKHAITGLDGFELDIDAMWADAERLPDEE